MKITRTLLLITVVTLFVGCNGKQAVRQSFNIPGSDSPQAWIDAPLPDMHIPLAPYEFVAHGTDQSGISQLEWILDGTSLGMEDAKNPADMLATFRHPWTPPGVGTYKLQVRAKNGAGMWSDFDEAVFTVGETTATITPTMTETPTPVITDTPTLIPTSTPTATLIPTKTKTPMQVPAEISFTPGLSINQFYFGNCRPNQVDVSVQLSSTNSVKHVELFVRLLDNNSSNSTAWDSYAVMSDNGSGLYNVALKSSKIQRANQFTSSVVVYQFIVVGTNGKVIARSDSYSDLSLNTCRGIILPPGRPTLVPTLIPPPR
jgi:hypothetical protein